MNDNTKQEAAELLLRMADLYSKINEDSSDMDEQAVADDCPYCDENGCSCENCPSSQCPCPITCMCPMRINSINIDSEDYDDHAHDEMYEAFQIEQEDALLAAGIVVPEEQDLANALIEITQKYGKFNSDDTGVWAGYEPAEKNDIKDIGVKCAN